MHVRPTMTTLQSNKEALDETKRIQDRTTEKLQDMIQQTSETNEIGVGTLESLERNRYQIQETHATSKDIQKKLKETERLQNRLDRWAFRFGRKKPAVKLAKQTMEHEKELRNIRTASKMPLKQEQVEEEPSKKLSKRDKKRSPNKTSNAPLSRTPLVGTLDPDLDETTRTELLDINDADKEVDTLLDVLGQSVDQLKDISKLMASEVSEQNKTLDEVQDSMDTVHEKQLVATTRMKHVLGGKWLRKDS